jgi:hypothetical protein
VPRWLAGALSAVALLALLAAGAGCGPARNRDDRLGATRPSPVRQPAAVAGGACQLLDYDVIEAQLGVRFDISASSTSDATYTCVVQPASAELPDLSLAVTASEADATIFKSTVAPKGGTPVSDLGKVAYSAGIPAGDGAGPGLEVGWLSGNQRLITLRYRGADGTAGGDVDALQPKLVALAKKIDLTSV